MLKVFRCFWFKHFLCHFQWYRRWYGGRWEYHWIDVCGSFMWLDMAQDRCWPDYRQPCSYGTPIVEDYPAADSGGPASRRVEGDDPRRSAAGTQGPCFFPPPPAPPKPPRSSA